MDDKERRALLDHAAGATVRHRSPFFDLEVPALLEPPPPEMFERWIKPFYLVRPDESAWAEALRPHAMVTQLVEAGGDCDSIGSMAGQCFGALRGEGALPRDAMRQLPAEVSDVASRLVGVL